jgi:hypothetical protein
MNQQQTPSPYAPPVAGEHPASPYDAPPAWVPASPTAFATPVAPPRRTFGDRMTAFRDQVVKLWAALAVGAACLVVGLGLGVLVGHETSGSGGTTQPTIGTNQVPGQGFGRHGFGGMGSDGQGFGQDPSTQSGGQSGTTSGAQPGTTTSGTAS